MATLALACVFAGAWMRSLVCIDEGNIPISEYSIDFVAGSGCLQCMWYQGRLPNSIAGTIRSRPVDRFNGSNEQTTFRSPFTVFLSEVQFGPNPGIPAVGFVLQYWSVVVPLTLLSAWLLLRKPRAAKMTSTD